MQALLPLHNIMATRLLVILITFQLQLLLALSAPHRGILEEGSETSSFHTVRKGGNKTPTVKLGGGGNETPYEDCG